MSSMTSPLAVVSTSLARESTSKSSNFQTSTSNKSASMSSTSPTRRLKVDYGRCSQAVLLTFCSCKPEPQLTDDHLDTCLLLDAITVLDDVVEWAVWETWQTINTEEEASRGILTVELPEPECATDERPVVAPPLSEG